ncbi:CoA pyrophosphatase [Marinobacterium arenosum]|uniref:CoA pyrophosphatase n=1 Tax=Marinobacterium arenosum TaxID=2862496 RepID=UPI001C93B66F|nr:CoA pyrophosphatase [Marinobacterium arenosum]MBY4676137.1 CoA pyrophosphatase [Marinobacterium arenosum]
MIRQLRERVQQHQPIRFRSDGQKAGVLVALTDHPVDPEVILTRRAAKLSTHSGEVAFPGGKHDETDPDLLYTALREAQEEVGLAPELVEVLGPLGQVMSKHRLQVTPYVGIVPQQVELEPNPGELDAVFRVPVSFFLEQQHFRTHSIRSNGLIHEVPAWRYEEFLIWGLTAYVLGELMNLAFDARIPLRARPEHRDLAG